MEINIDQIQPNSYNPKSTEENLEKYEAIKTGIVEMGMKTPIDVREIEGEVLYEIIDGYHRWKACKELGWDKVPIASWGKIDDERAKKITILKEKARIPLDILMTSKILVELSKDTALDDLAKQLGYELPDLKADIQLADYDLSDYNNVDRQKDMEENEIRTLSVVMTLGQYEVVNQAIDKAKKEGQTNSEARALELICGDYLA